jgi:hypothetical protein
MNLGLVYVNVLFSNWNNRSYDALKARRQVLARLAYFASGAGVHRRRRVPDLSQSDAADSLAALADR